MAFLKRKQQKAEDINKKIRKEIDAFIQWLDYGKDLSWHREV